MKTSNKLLILSIIAAMSILASCSGNITSSSQSNTSISTIPSNTETIPSSTSNIVNNKKITLNNESITITEVGEYEISGTIPNGQIIIDTGEDTTVILHLSDVNITNTSGSAIYVKSGKASINLVDGTTNIVTDGKTYSDTSDEAPNATIYANEDLKITGNGSLIVKANYNDGIATKDDLEISGGDITVTSADDAIRGTDSLIISGGTFNITATGDALKSSNETKAGKGYIHITGGDFTISANSDGIQGVSKVTIDGGNINIKTNTEGIEATQIYINRWNIQIYATDDGINASQKGLSDGTDIKIEITGGILDISMAQGDTDAIDSNGDVIVTGGTINITAQFAFDFDGNVTYTGGDIIVNWQKITTITNSMMWPGSGRGFNGGMRPIR